MSISSVASPVNFDLAEPRAVSSNQLVFIDRNISDYEVLAAGLVPGLRVVVLSGEQDGIDQMTLALAGCQGLAAIHVVSHGLPGLMQLGNGHLCLGNMAEYADRLRSWSGALAVGGEILLYGCEVGQGDGGAGLVWWLSELTGVRVVAKATKTGNARLGGDWNLVAGVPLAFSAAVMDSYEGVLANFPGTSGIDALTGTSDADLIDGLAGDDVLSGLGGNDTINGGNGIDTISGGDGDDIINPGLFVFGRLLDSVDGGAGVDTLILDQDLANSLVNQSLGFDAARGTYFGPVRRFSNVERFNIHGSRSDDTITAGDFNDTLIGGQGNDILNGGGGDDILIGVDRRFENRTDSDIVTGGAGSDRFILGESGKLFYGLGGSTNIVNILDFDASDHIEIPNGLTYSLKKAGGLGSNVTILSATTPRGLIDIAIITSNIALDINNANQFRRFDGLIDFGDNNSGLSTVDIRVENPTLKENDLTKSSNYILTRTGDTSKELTVAYTIAGTASASDYIISQQGIGTFAAGAGATSVTLNVAPDQIFEGAIPETIVFTITPRIDYIVGTNNTGVISIDDDDSRPTVSISNFSAFEDISSSFTVSLDRPSVETVTVAVSTKDGLATIANSDYQAVTNQLVTFAPGEIKQVVNVAIVDDTEIESAETFSVVLSNPINSSIDPAKGVGIGTIANNDLATINVTANKNELSENAGDNIAQLTFTRNGSNVDGLPDVFYTITGGDSQKFVYSLPGKISFAPGSSTTVVDFKVPDDTIFSPIPKVIELAINPSSFLDVFNVPITPQYKIGQNPSTSITILDNDVRPTINFSFKNNSSFNLGNNTSYEGIPFRLEASLSNFSTESVSADYTITDSAGNIASSDFFAPTGTINVVSTGVFSDKFDLIAINDADTEENEVFIFKLSNPRNATGFGQDQIALTVVDDDNVINVSVANPNIVEGNGNGVFTLTRTGNLTNRAEPLYFVNKAAVRPITSNAFFEPGQDTIYIEVPNPDNNIYEGKPRALELELLAGNNVQIGADRSGIIYIADNESKPTVSVSNIVIVEGNREVAGREKRAVFSVNLSNPSVEPIEFNYSTADGTATANGTNADYQAVTNQNFIINPGQTRATVEVIINGDVEIEDSESFTLNLTDIQNASNTAATGTATITDEDLAHAPTIANPVGSQNLEADKNFELFFDANIFTDVDPGDSSQLRYSVKLADGNNLPTWLNYNSRTLVGTPGSQDVGILSLALTATDPTGLSITNNFDLNIGAAVNVAPQNNKRIGSRSVNVGSLLAILPDPDTFTDTNSNDRLTYSAKLSDGSDLPAWISLSASSSGIERIVGTPTEGDIGEYSIVITATDLSGLSATSSFNLTVNSIIPAKYPPVINNNDIVFSGNTAISITPRMLASNAIGGGIIATPEQVKYTINSLPAQGGLKLNGVAIAVGGTFTQADINSGKLTYLPTLGNTATADGFSFTLTNGVTSDSSTAIAANIRIVPIDPNEPVVFSVFANDIDAAETVVGATPNPGSITFRRSGDITKSAQVNYSIDSNGFVDITGKTTSGKDHERPTGIATFAVGSADAVVTFNIIDDTLLEGEENAQIRFPTGGLGVGGLLKISDNETVIKPYMLKTDIPIESGIGGLLTYTVDRLPTKGRLKIGDKSLIIGSTFTQTDVADGRLFYSPREAGTTPDGFGFTVTGGVAKSLPGGIRTQLVSIDSNGEQSRIGSAAYDGAISGNGRYVVFVSGGALAAGSTAAPNASTNIYVRDLVEETTEDLFPKEFFPNRDAFGVGFFPKPSISDDGRYVAYLSHEDAVLVIDRQTHTSQKASVTSSPFNSNGVPGTVNYAAISGNGRYVVFSSSFDILVANDTNAVADVFVHDLQSQTTQRVSLSNDGNQIQGGSRPAISGDGRYVVFESGADNVVAGDVDRHVDIFLRDLQANTTRKISFDLVGEENNNTYSNASISADGRYVAFISSEIRRIAAPEAVRLYDTQTGITEVIAVISDGQFLSNIPPAISADGRYVTFTSSGVSLVPGIDSSKSKIVNTFVKDRQTNTTRLVSIDLNGGVGDATQSTSAIRPTISTDGRYITFSSESNNLVAKDVLGGDVFVADLNPLANALTTTGHASIDIAPPGVGGTSVVTIDDETEDLAPNNGDGNFDGILDKLQENITSLFTPGGTGTSNIATLATNIGLLLSGVKFIDNPSPGNAPASITFPTGFADFQIDGLANGAASILEYFIPQANQNAAFNTYYMFAQTAANAVAQWYEFLYDGKTGARFVDTNNDGTADKVVLNFIDGLRGDADGLANGTVQDPGAPGVIATPVTITTDADNTISLTGAGAAFANFSLVSKNTKQVNEVGFFKLDATNAINGVAPTAPGFALNALQSGQVIFSTLADNLLTATDISRKLQVSGGDKFGFFLVKNGTVDDAIAKNDFSNVVFSNDQANLGGKALQTVATDNGVTLKWEQGNDQSFDDVVINLQVNAAPLTNQNLVATLQGQKEGEVVDLRNFGGKTVKADFIVKREAAYNNTIGFYKIDDAAGSITTITGAKLAPGEAGYSAAVVQNRIAGVDLAVGNGQTATINKTIAGGELYAPFLIANGKADTLNGNFDNVYTLYSLGNSDKTDHIRLLGDNTFGFEDLAGGGDKDFNDVIVKATFTV
jgi:Domain of unknown function (DUF4347)/Putative Ig domain/Calx-beta domain/Domain of unknown function (DUF4114)/RTX calcium-binding nonapeptide repeat (4 copies)